jgi:Predicted membrane protein
MSGRPAATPEEGDPRSTTRTPERRWPMAFAVLAAIVLQVVTPHTGRLVFWWVFPVLELIALVVMIVRDPGRIDRRTRAARRATIVLIVLLTIGTVAGLVVLVFDILDKNYAPEVGATALLGRGVALWVTNVVVFSLWFWELDRGGAAERAAASGISPSFGFPEDAMPELVTEGWMPRYPDYLYLSFTNATPSARPTRCRFGPGRR